MPGSELIAQGTELRALVGDEAFFAAHDYRTTRFPVVVPECRVLGLAYGELLQGKSVPSQVALMISQCWRALSKRTVNLAPLPAVLSQVTAPPIASTSFLTMLRPSPAEGSPPVGCAESRP